MENLTKYQLILLALLISFVTSMATGIASVALMNQAPPGVTETVDRVVERTIEQIVPASTSSSQTGQITKETIVVSSDDETVAAIDKNSKSLVRIWSAPAGASTTDLSSMTFVGIGVVVSDDGVIAADNGVIAGDGSASYFTPDDSGALHPLDVVRAASGEHVALLKIRQDPKNPIVIPKAVLASSDLKLGQTVIYLGGASKNSVATGIVSSLGVKSIAASSTASTSSSTPASVSVISSIDTSVSGAAFTPGGLLLDLSGDLVGIKTAYPEGSATDLFAPVSEIRNELSLVSTSTASQ